MPKLSAITPSIRSKNAEPFLTTLDVFFDDADTYERLKQSGSVTAQRVAEAYNVPPEVVWGIFFIDDVKAMKITLYKYSDGRYLGQGDTTMSDMFGSQQHVPLMEMEVDL
jgi:hypothetical protein